MTLLAPFVFSDAQLSPDECAALKALGIAAVAFQITNEPLAADAAQFQYDVTPARNAGLRVWGWTCVYQEGLFASEGAKMGANAVKYGVENLIVDGEFSLGNLRGAQPSRVKPLFDAIRAAGYAGPISETPLGAPSDPLVDDYNYPDDEFLATGGRIYAESPYPQDQPYPSRGESSYAYPAWQDLSGYNAANAVAYWKRIRPGGGWMLVAGLHSISYPTAGTALRQTADDAARLLRAAGYTLPLGIFQAKNLLADPNPGALRPWFYTPSSKVGDTLVASGFADISKGIDQWRAAGLAESKVQHTNAYLAASIKAMANTDPRKVQIAALCGVKW